MTEQVTSFLSLICETGRPINSVMRYLWDRTFKVFIVMFGKEGVANTSAIIISVVVIHMKIICEP